jgi:hypothetical protein
MALPEMRVKIAADTTDVQTDFTKLNQTLDRLEDKIGMTVNASGRLVDKFGQVRRITDTLEQSMRDAGIKTDDLADIMLQARNQATGLGRAMKVANDNVRAAGTTALPQATRSSGAFGRSLQNVSFQVGDFATQVGAGTAASVALGQQLPQLLGGFGILGAALGAVVAIAVPLTKSLVSMSEGAKLTSDQFGVFEPVIIGVADAFKALKPIISDALSFLAAQLESVLLGGAAVAAFFAGKWVVAFTAAKVATLSVAGAMGFLRTAIIRTGFGAFIVGLGEVIHQLVSANSWVRKLAIRLNLISASGAAELRTEIAALGAQIETITAKLEALQKGETDHSKSDRIAGIKAFSKVLEDLKVRLAGAKAELQALENAKKAASDSITLLDFGGEDKEKDKLKKDIEDRNKLRDEEMQRQRERLEEGLQAIRESQLTEQQMLFKHLLDKKAIIDEAYEQDMVTDAERKELWRELQAEHNQKMLELEERKQQKEAGKKGALYQKIANLQKGNLSEQLSNNLKFWGQLAQQTGIGGKKVFAAIQILAAAEGLVNSFLAFTQVLRDEKLGFYEKIVAAATVLAAGLNMVQAIKGVTASGGGGGAGRAAAAAGGGGGGTAGSIAPAESSRPRGPAVSLTLVGDQGFSRAQIVQIAEALNDAGDEGQLVQITGRR